MYELVFCCKQCHFNNNINNTEHLQNTSELNVKPMPTSHDASRFVIDRAVMAYKETETDVLYGVAIRPRGDGV